MFTVKFIGVSEEIKGANVTQSEKVGPSREDTKAVVESIETGRKSYTLQEASQMDAGDIIYEAMETEGQVFIVDNNLKAAERFASLLNGEMDMELEMLAESVSVEKLKDQGFADDVVLHIEQLKKAMNQQVASTKRQLPESMKEMYDQMIEEEDEMAKAQEEAKQTVAKSMENKNKKEMGNMQTMSEAQRKLMEMDVKKPASVVENEKKLQEPKKEEKKEEVNMEDVMIVGGAKGFGGQKQEEKKEEKKQEKKGGRRPKSAGSNEGTEKSGGTNRVLDEEAVVEDQMRGGGFDEEEKGAKREKSNKPWYLNTDLHPVVADVVDVVTKPAGERGHEELGFTNIRFRNPKAIFGAEKVSKTMKMVVTLDFANGVSLNLRIQNNNNPESKSDLKSSNIVWTEKWNPTTFRKELTPEYSFFRMNSYEVAVTCDGIQTSGKYAGKKCGKKFNAVAGEKSKCPRCEKVYTVNASVKKEGMDVETVGYVRQSLGSHIEVSPAVLAFAMAAAQWKLGKNMHGLDQ